LFKTYLGSDNNLHQLAIDTTNDRLYVEPFKQPLLKWVGNKQRFATEIISYFPHSFNTYFEPFLGSGAIMGTLIPKRALVSDCFTPLMEIWTALHDNPDRLKQWYTDRWERLKSEGKKDVYEDIKASYNAKPNGADFLFLSRACYGGVIRFRKADGYMSTPCGVHNSISPLTFAKRVDEWHKRTLGVVFKNIDFEESMRMAKRGDLVYCDPPYSHSQAILYGAQSFSLERLLNAISDCKSRGVYVALSIDGKKKSGNLICDLPIPESLFEREVFIHCGHSMLKRFQMGGKELSGEIVHDRLLLTY